MKCVKFLVISGRINVKRVEFFVEIDDFVVEIVEFDE